MQLADGVQASVDLRKQIDGLLAIELFGAGRVTVGRRRVVLRGHPKMRALLGFLALQRGTLIEREEVAAAIWPDVPDAAARGNLRRHIGYLSEVLDEPGETSWIERSPTHVGLNVERPIWTDTGAFLACCADDERLAEAKQLYAGELLAGYEDEWIVATRARFVERYVDVLERLVALERRNGNRAAALLHATDVLRSDPYREDTVRDVMRLRFSQGDRAGALREYDRFERLIRAELAAAPAPETIHLAAALREHEPAARPVRDLPAEQSSFIGRAHELEQLGRLIADTRLVTIAGPPGVGKTRLALRFAHARGARFADGARFVDLSAATTAQTIEHALDDALEFRARLRDEAKLPIEQRLRKKQLLIILDNCEQAVDGCVALIARVLRAAPGVSIVVTSRAVLRARGEAVFNLTPLGRGDAERLFVERARFARRGFSPDALGATALSAIVDATDGLPLALELCAARLRTLSIGEVVARLHRLLDLVGNEPAGGDDLARTLRVSLESSYALLGESERRLFRRFAVFPGSADVAAIRTIALDGASEAAAIEVLARLVDHSLLVAPAIDAPVQRFSMLRSIADFAREKLALDDDAQVIVTRHARYFAETYVALNDELRGARAYDLFGRVAADYDDLLAALQHLIVHRVDPELGARLALALSRFWFDRGFAREGAEWLKAAAAGETLTPQLRALVLHALATLIRNQGNFELAFTLFGEALEALRDCDDRRAVGKALATYSNAARVIGKTSVALDAAAEALTIFEAAGDPYLCGYALLTSGCAAFAAGQLAAARTSFRESLERYREAGAEADIALALGNLGAVAYYENDLRVAALLCRESSDRARGVGNVYYQASADLTLARIAVLEHDAERARALLTETARRAQAIADTELLMGCLELHAMLILESRPLRAATLLACVDATRVRDRIPRSPVEHDEYLRLRERLELRLPAADARAAAEAGRALSFADAITELVPQQAPAPVVAPGSISSTPVVAVGTTALLSTVPSPAITPLPPEPAVAVVSHGENGTATPNSVASPNTV